MAYVEAVVTVARTKWQSLIPVSTEAAADIFGIWPDDAGEQDGSGDGRSAGEQMTGEQDRRHARVTATAHCVGRCDWTAAGDWTTADKQAEAHTRKSGHPTATVAAHSDHGQQRPSPEGLQPP